MCRFVYVVIYMDYGGEFKISSIHDTKASAYKAAEKVKVSHVETWELNLEE